MKLLLDRFYNMQAELDSVIAGKHGLELNTKENWQDRSIALFVELGELANELRFFKFWSTDMDVRREKALAEYADCIHFSLSLINTFGGRDLEFNFPNDLSLVETKQITLKEMFSLVQKFATSVYENPVHIGYAFMSLLDLGYVIGFTWDEIVAAYETKHAENLRRQAAGY